MEDCDTCYCLARNCWDNDEGEVDCSNCFREIWASWRFTGSSTSTS